MKILFFFTAKYPFGKGDSFVENEMPYLAKAFDKIIIISNECNDPQTKWVPENAAIERISYELSSSQNKKAIFGVFSKQFWSEISCIKKVYRKKITSIIFKTALISLFKSKFFGDRISQLFAKYSKPEDTVYAYSYWANDMAVALANLKPKFPQVKMISRAHGWDVYFEANLANYLPFRKNIFEQLDTVYFISNKGIHYYQNYFPELNNKMAVSRLGVAKQTQRNDLGNEQRNEFTIVSCSHILRIKRVHLIAEALAEITNLSVRWIHFGDGALFENLKNRSTELLSKMENIHVEFPGNVPNETVMHYFENNPVDAIINVSSTEGVPVSIMEAMSFGVPAIATNVGGTSEIVDDGNNGFLLSSDPTPQEIAERLKMFFQMTKSEQTIMRQNAFKTWETKYSSDANYNEFINQIL